MITACRVVAVNPENQTVDLLREEHYTQWVKGNLAETVSIISNVPYGSSMIQDYGASYLWGFFNSEGIHLAPAFKETFLEKYGPNFHFGRFNSPAYFKAVHEKYYKGKGSNPKTVTGGIAFKPAEGSLAIYEDKFNIVLGFIGIGGYVSLLQEQYAAPHTKGSQPEFSREYQTPFETEFSSDPNQAFADILRGSHSTLGYHSKLKLQIDDEKELIDEYGRPHYAKKTYPVISPYIYYQNVNPAHPEDLSEQYVRFKQNEYKRLCDIYNTSVKDVRAKAKTGTLSSSAKDVDLLFDNNFTYNPDKHFVSFSNYSLYDEDILENFLKEPTGDKDYAFKGADGNLACLIVPESGIKHFRDGKILLYTDTYGSFADFDKATNYEEYIDIDSTFYKKSLWTNPKDEFLSNNINYVKYLNNTDLPNDFTYKFDQYKVDKLEREEERKVPSFDDRGSYVVVDPAYLEISSDSKKGGYLFFKAAKKHTRIREYEKNTVFSNFETFRDVIGVGSGAVKATHCFEHNDLTNHFSWEVLTDHSIQEGTWALESPLIGVRSFREYHSGIESLVFESKRSGGKPHDAGVYIGSSSAGGSTETNDGGCVVIRAGVNNIPGGNLAATTAKPEANQGGRIVLEAHEIQLNTNRLLIGQIRVDQKDKMSKLNLGVILLGLIPMEGQTVQKVGDLIYQNYPVQNRVSLATFAASTGTKDGTN